MVRRETTTHSIPGISITANRAQPGIVIELFGGAEGGAYIRIPREHLELLQQALANAITEDSTIPLD
jgi:hypothetical protein